MLPVYVIHAKALAERVASISGQLDRIGLPFEWVLDHDPEDITAELEARYFRPGNVLTPGQKSCALKHIAVMERICARGQDRALVLEDDALLCADFMKGLHAVLVEAEGWPRPHVLHLGIADNFYVPASQLVPSQRLYRGHRVRNTEAYVLGVPEAEQRLTWIRTRKLAEPIDLSFNVADPELGIPFLWAEPPLAEQGSLTGRFASSLNHNGHSLLRLRLEFGLQKLMNRWLARWFRLN